MGGVREKLLEDFRSRKRRGLDALARGDRQHAREELLGAAESLYRLARCSGGELRARRIRSARKLLESARALGGRESPSSEDGRQLAGEGFRAHARPRLSLDDIAGLDDAKEALLLRLVYPFQHEEAARRFGIPRGGGVLLFGPPGTGKTLLARATAGQIDAEFFTVKPSEILSKWVGEAERNVESLFRAARSCSRSVIFIDELDALAPARRDNPSSVMSRVVPQILAELEGFASDSPNTLLFLGATNEPWSIDSAVLRPGRFDEKIYVGLPDTEAILKILHVNLAGKPLASDVDLRQLARQLRGYSGADIRNICRRAACAAFLKEVRGAAGCLLDKEILHEEAARTPASVGPETLRMFQEYARTVAVRPAMAALARDAAYRVRHGDAGRTVS